VGPQDDTVFARVTDLDAAIESLGGPRIEPIDSVTDSGPVRFATFLDPDGNKIQLLER
jgi:predicted enzyme related to lactoylglutathione lyase